MSELSYPLTSARPFSASVGICVTFVANIPAIVVLIGIQMVAARAEWLLVPPLLAEVYVICVGRGRPRQILPA